MTRSTSQGKQRVREDAVKVLGRITDAEWKLVVERGYVNDVLRGDEDALEFLVDHLRRNRDVYEQPRGPGGRRRSAKDSFAPPERRKEETLRQRVLSAVVWDRAKKDEEVLKFRAEVFNGQPLSLSATWDDVSKHMKAADRRRTSKLPAKGEKRRQAPRPVTSSTRTWLERLAGRLSAELPWSYEQALGFVIHDACPLVSMVSVSFLPNTDVPSVSRLLLSVDPTATVDEVKAAFQQAKREVVGQNYRSLGDKHAYLAFFTLDAPTRRTWAERMAYWNQCHPDWTYARLSNFRRDAGAAASKLFRPKFGESSVQGENVFLDLGSATLQDGV